MDVVVEDTAPPISWDGKLHSYRPDANWRDRVSPKVQFHDESDENLDAVTFEVLRNRLWMSNLAHGETLTRISGSPVFQALDFNMCIMTESAELVVNGPFILYLASGAPLAVPYILEKLGDSPGIDEGDMILVSDPWIGVPHQMDILMACPVFVDGRVFAWVCNAGHHYDLGGVAPGGWPQNAVDIFWDPIAFAPFKLVEKDVLRTDLAAMVAQQSRVPDIVALDLRSQIAGCRYARTAILEMCDEFGASVVKAAMRRILDNAQRSLQQRFARMPDSSLSAVRYISERLPGERDSYRVQLNATKRGERLTIDNLGTDPMLEGPSGCVFTAFAGWVLGAFATTMLWEHTFSLGGASRAVDLEPLPGLLTCVDRPAAVSGGVANSALVYDAMMAINANLLASNADQRQDAMPGVSMSVQLILAGEDDRGRYVGQALFDSSAAMGLPATPVGDGVDTGGSLAVILMRLLNVEEYEQFFPIIYLYRRERIDGAGVGRWRGGVGGEAGIVTYRARRIDVIAYCNGTGIATHSGEGHAGGYPSPPSEALILKQTNVRDLFAQGILPSSKEEIQAESEIRLPGKSPPTPLEFTDVLTFRYSGGGGYGDPLQREPELVERDVQSGHVSAETARTLYGVEIGPTGVEAVTTRALREQLLEDRKSWQPSGAGADEPSPQTVPATGEPPQQINDYVVACDHDGERVLACARCNARLAPYRGNLLAGLLLSESPLTIIPQVFDPAFFLDDEFQLRRYCCPGCRVLMMVLVVRADQPQISPFTLL
jgi:N-methylhydantoinase B